GTPEQAAALIAWFKARGCYVVGGVPYQWRTGTGDARPGFLAAYRLFDMIQPWSVGRYASDADLAAHMAGIMVADKAACDAAGQAYQRVIFPGFAWSNWNGGPRNAIPRHAGEFFWRQACAVKKLGASAFIAMFDEYDEATAIAKAAEDASMAPAGQ